MADPKETPAALTSSSQMPQPPSRLKREMSQRKIQKSFARLSAVKSAIAEQGGEVSVPITAQDAAAIWGSKHLMEAMADFMDGLTRYGTMQPNDVRLSAVDEKTAALHSSTRRDVEKALYARSERQIQMAAIAQVIDFVLACPGDNVEVCDVLWRIYEGYQDVEEGRRVPAFEPSGSQPGGVTKADRYAERMAVVSAGISAYMLAGLTEAAAVERALASVQRTTPAFFGLHTPALSAETLSNWRSGLMKGRGPSVVVEQFRKWQRTLVAMRKSEPERLIPWADRLLHAAIRREL